MFAGYLEQFPKHREQVFIFPDTDEQQPCLITLHQAFMSVVNVKLTADDESLCE